MKTSADLPLRPVELEWIRRSMGAGYSVLAASELAGATSGRVFRVLVDNGRQSTDVAFRRYSLPWFRVAAEEAQALRIARRAGVPTPEIIAYDDTATDDHDPMTLTTFLPGRVVLRPDDLDDWLRQMADALFLIHQVSGDDAPGKYEPWYAEGPLEPPAWSTNRKGWERAIEVALGAAPNRPRHFLHRDYHPCNILFDQGRLSGVVDWPNGCRGMAGVDVAHCRWNLALLEGVKAADRFLEIYTEIAGSAWEYEPYFDLVELCEKLAFLPAVYDGWPANGVHGLNDRMMLERTEKLLEEATQRIG